MIPCNYCRRHRRRHTPSTSTQSVEMFPTVCIHLTSRSETRRLNYYASKEDLSVPGMILLIVLKGHIGRNEHAHKLSSIRM